MGIEGKLNNERYLVQKFICDIYPDAETPLDLKTATHYILEHYDEFKNQIQELENEKYTIEKTKDEEKYALEKSKDEEIRKILAENDELKKEVMEIKQQKQTVEKELENNFEKIQSMEQF